MFDFVSLNLKCPICGISLMNREILVDKKASIHLKIRMGEVEGSIYLSSLYGSYNYQCDLSLANNQIAHFYCNHCKHEITSKSECQQCGAPMVPLYLDMGGKVSICSRSGCKNHFVEFEDLNLAMQKLYEDYGFDDPSVHTASRASVTAKQPPAPKPVEDCLCPHCQKSLVTDGNVHLIRDTGGTKKDWVIPFGDAKS